MDFNTGQKNDISSRARMSSLEQVAIAFAANMRDRFPGYCLMCDSTLINVHTNLPAL